MKQTLLQIMVDTTKEIAKTKNGTTSDNNFWIWVAVAEFLVIGFLAFKLLKKKKLNIKNEEIEIFNEAKNSNIDMESLINNINKSGQLYKKLSSKCHPDRFVFDEGKQKISSELFQEITKNKRNYNKLLELQDEAKQKLNIEI